MPTVPRRAVRLVLDTNTALSGLLWQGTPGKLIDATKRQEVKLFSSTPLLVELLGVVTRPKFADALGQCIAQFRKVRGLTAATGEDTGDRAADHGSL